MADYSIKLGIDLDTSDLQGKINKAGTEAKPIPIKLEIENLNDIKKQIQSLGDTKTNKSLLKFDTESLEASLRDVSTAIKDIKASLGTLDDKSGMKSLLSSVNQIATALGKVENESDSLLKSLSALGKKDFSINLGIDMGKKNNNMIAYGRAARKQIIPELEAQIKELEGLFGGQQAAMSKLASKGNKVGFDVFTDFGDFNSDSAIKKMEAMEKYINSLKKLAALDNVKLDGFNEVHKNATELINDITGVEDALDKAGDVPEKIKKFFGGSLDIEGLAGQLQPIITDLGEIKTVIQSLSSNNSIDGLTQSFNRLSETLDKLTSNFTLAKNTLDTGFSNVATDNNAVKVAQQTGQKIGETIGKSTTQFAKQSINLDDVIDEQVLKLMNEYAIAGDKSSNAFKEIRQSLVDFRNGSEDINKVTSAISNNMKVVNEAKNDYKELAEQIKWFNSHGAKVHLPDSIKQEYGDDFESMRKQLGSGRLGNAFTTGQGMDFEAFVVELNSILGQTIDLSHGAEAAFGDLVRKVNSTKGGKFLTGDDLFRTGRLNMGDVVANVSTSLEQIENAEEQIAQASTAASNTINQNEERKQQAYRETSGVIENLKTTLETMKVDRSSIDTVIKDMEELGFTATDTSVKMKNGGFDITVKGIDSIGRAITEIRHLDSATDEISLVDRKITQSLTETDRFVKQQKQAVSNLTNQINQLNRSAIDQNASRPIKDSAHLDALADKYDEITLAIQRMENASSDTFVDEQNNVKALISDYKSLVSEFKNAENVSSKMKGTDFASGLDIAKNDLEKFKAQAKDFPQITSTVEDLDRAIEGVGDAASLNKFNDQLRVARSELAKVKSETTALNRSEKVGINISGLESKIADLQRISPEVDKFEAEIDGAKVSVQSLLSDLKQVNTQSDFSVVNSKWKAFTDAAKAAGIAVTETATKARTALANDIKFDIEVGNFDNEMDTMIAKFNSLSDANDDLRRSYDATKDAYKAMIDAADTNTGDEVADRERLIQAEKEYAAALEKTNNLIKKQARADKIDADAIKLQDNRDIFQAKIDTWLTKNSAATKQFGNAMLKLKAQAESCDQVTLNHLEKQFKKLDTVADKAGLKVESLGDRIKSKFKEYSAYLSVAEVFMYISQGMQDMFEQVKLIDSAMTELKKVTNETDASYNQFLSNAASRAKAIGTTIDGLVTSTADFARLGYGFKESQELAEVANIYAVVGDEIDGVEGATESLISTMTAFGIEASNSMSIVDKFNIIGNNFAISSGGIGEALERSASSMAAANNSLDETIALITAANTVVQDPASVGQAFKTISMRIRGAKTEMEEAGLETDGMAESTAKLRSEIMALSGVDIMLDSTTFKSTYQIMEELATKWQDLTDIQQASITELIAGKRQGNIVSSLMMNFDIAQNALQTSLDSSGSAMEEHGKYMDSIEAKLSQLKSAWQGFAQTFMNSDFLKGGIDVLKTIIDFLEKLVDNFGLLGTVGLGAGITGIIQYFRFLKNDGVEAVKTITDVVNAINNITSAVSNVSNSAQTMGNVVETAGDIAEAIGDTAEAVGDTVEAVGDGAKVIGSTIEATGDIAGAVGDSAEAIGNVVEAAGDGVEAMTDLGGAATKTGGSFKAFMKTPMGVASAIGVAIAAIGLLYNAYKNAKEAAAEARQEAIESSDAYLDAASSFEQAYVKYSGRTDLTSDEEAELESAIQGTVDALGDKSSALQSAVNSSNDYLASLEAIKDAELDAAKTAAENKRDKAADTLKEAAIGWESFDGSEVNIKLHTADKEAQKIAKEMGSEFVESQIVSIARSPKAIEDITLRLSGEADVEEIVKYYNFLKDYQKELKAAGLEDTDAYEKVEAAIGKMSESISVYTDGVYEAVKANYQLSEGIPKTVEEYIAMREAIIRDAQLDGFSLDKKMSVLNSLDSEYGQLFDLSSAEAQARKFVGIIKGFGDGTKDGTDEIGTVETFLNMRTALNNNECTVGEYLSELDNITSMSEKFSDEEKKQFNLAYGLDTDSIKKQYEHVYNYISRNYLDKLNTANMSSFDASEFKSHEEKKIKDILNSLSATELQAVANIKGEINWETTNTDEILAQIKEEAKFLEAMNYTIAIDVETESLDALNSALSESVSATGLSSDSIAALKGRYAELASQGYDLSAMFEETSNGIHLNKNAVSEFEQALASQKLSETDSKLDVLKKRYDELTNEINNCTDAGERASLYSDQQEVAQKINDLATLASQYKGLTSAYNAWQNAESAGNERDMYENIISGFETIGDEISRGWYDDGTIKFLELMTGKTDLAGKSASELKKIWKSLDETIEGTSYSVRDFFTTDKDGNSTSTGAYNFLRAVEELGKNDELKFENGKTLNDLITRKDGKEDGAIVAFDFGVVGGDKAIAEALGVSEEMVQIIQRTLDDAGFVVTLDGKYTLLADLKTSAEDANNSLKKLKSQGLESLKNVDLNFDFNVDTVEGYQEQLEKALNVLDKFRNKDGTLQTDKNGNLVKGAKEALEIAEYYTAAMDKLTEPKFMQIDTSAVDSELQDPIEKMQTIGDLCKEKHLVSLTGDTKELDKVQGEIDKVAKEIEELDPEVKAKIGIDEDWDAKTIAAKIEKGEIEVPAELKLDVQMSEDLKDMRLLMMRQLGLVSEEEVKLKVGYEIDESTVDKLTPDEQKVAVEFIAENEDWFDKLSDDKKKIVVNLVANGVDLSALDDEKKEIVVEYVEKNKEKFDQLSDADKKVFVNYIANGGDVEKFESDLENRNRNIEIIAETHGVEDVEGLKSAMSGLTDEQVKAIAEAIGKGDVDALDSAVEGMDDNTVKAIANALGYDDVQSLRKAVNSLTDNEVKASATTSGKGEVDGLNSSLDTLKKKDGTKVTITTILQTIKETINRVASGGAKKAAQRTGVNLSPVNGTANVNGTVGRAFKQGSWGTKNSGTALVGELGREVLVRDGRYYTIGDNGAEFIKYKKGDIIFNHVQSDELFKNGKVTSGGGRAKALVDGSAFAQGTAFSKGSGGGEEPEVTSVVVGTNKNTGKSYTKSTDDSKDDFEELFDLIEIAISRIEREIDNLDQKASNIYKSWSSRNSALVNQIGKVGDEITLQQKAYDEYMKAAAGVGLSSNWVKKIQNGEIDIETVKDEVLAEKIKDYEKYYQAALACKDAILELQEAESSLYAQRFENIQTQYDGILQGYEHTEAMLNEYISQAEEQGFVISKKYYQALVANEKQNIAELKKEQVALIEARNEAVASGTITKNSEAWYEQCAAIDEVTQAIEEGSTALLEYARAMEEIDWSIFDLIQERISDVTEEADFLIELMSNKKLFDDDGKLTSQGLATMGLHAQNYNTHMYAADTYGEEVAKLDKQIAKDPYDQELINRRNELLELQRESILAAEQEKDAIADLVEQGIEKELDSLSDLIDEYNEALDSQKDLYDYERKIESHTKNIGSLEKQLASYEGDTSEESKATVQRLKLELEEANADLESDQYDKYISDQQELLDTLYNEYELILNSRLDNIDYLLESVIDSINIAASADGNIATALGSEGALAVAVSNNATSIKDTLTSEAKNVGISLSNSLNSIWSTGEGNAKSVLTMYGEDFRTKSATIITTLNSIKTDIAAMVDDVDKDAQKKVTANKTTTSAKKDPVKTTTPTSNKKPSSSSSSSSSSSGDGKPKIGDKVTYVSGQYYYDSQGKKPLGSKYKGKQVYITNINTRGWATHGYHISTGNKLGKGDLGWLKLNQLSGYAVGKQNFLNDEVAWTQENGKEFIIRPSDGAILTPIAKSDSVLTSAASNNIWDMANSPAEFIKDNLKMDASSIPNVSSVNNSIVQNFENITFSMPNVHGYNELLTEMQRDKNFEKLVLSMTVDRIAGKSNLAKGKSIRH